VWLPFVLEAVKALRLQLNVIKRVNYEHLEKVLISLIQGESDAIALMATVASEVHHSDDRFDWTGFYRVTEPELLKIGPYQGGHGCLLIPFSSGVCGTAARTGIVRRVDDVKAFEGHIVCSSSTCSELVIPVFGKDKKLIAVFDIDSDRPNAFDQKDADALDAILKNLFSDI